MRTVCVGGVDHIEQSTEHPNHQKQTVVALLKLSNALPLYPLPFCAVLFCWPPCSRRLINMSNNCESCFLFLCASSTGCSSFHQNFLALPSLSSISSPAF